jgi:hypothetical protein
MLTLPKNSPKRVVDHPSLDKDFIQSGDINQVNLGPEILRDPIIQQQFANWGYAIIQIGDRLVRVYGQPTDPKWRTGTPVPEKPAPQYDAVKLPDPYHTVDDTPGTNPSPYTQMPYGQDPRYEMSTQDNLERNRNQLKAARLKAYSSDQPRVPAGKREGGQFMDVRGTLPKPKPKKNDPSKKDVDKIVRDVIQALVEDTK